jgi:hypothetical protein
MWSIVPWWTNVVMVHRMVLWGVETFEYVRTGY